ncbi:uncharacterized protein LOC129579895 isoform X2 [Sitodiplosis mosellana]|uniref:uncharacterized protein LOC129579895 isoform X2 n=1 Tax=Sitodiplosis mosellana TaxID=263140 RepID=UPI002443D8D7|nr:uncharacterized protein LOC129579895 isoform X2 [Sitodiplosis mosellana]
MDEAINFLNVEIGVFLRYLRCFSKIENVQISKKTMELMQEVFLNMKELSQNARIIENSVKNDVDFLFELNEHQYELQRHILCRTCLDLFPLTKHDFLAHLKTKHRNVNSTGSNSFSSEFLAENESTIYQFNGHNKSVSPNSDGGHHSSSVFSDQGFVEDSSFSQSNVQHPRYSDILRTAVPAPEPEENVVNIKPIDMLMTLGDLIRTDRCFEAISVEMVNFMTRTDQRIQCEKKILDILTKAVNLFDPFLKVLSFGSVEYSFSGPNTNYNLLIDTRKSGKAPALLLRTFQSYFTRSEVQRYFDTPVKINSNRVQKQQLQMVHKESGIKCLLVFDNDITVSNAAKIINDFIALKPICRQLIAYVRAWQNVVNDLATQHGDAAFHFNTYIISVLVIFFMQVQYDLPTAADVSILVASGKVNPSAKSILEEQKDFGRILYEFFHFYGIRYEINNHLISARIGRWQEQRLTQQQKLRDGMNASVANWQKCTMFVQDLIVAGVNITAEIPKEQAYNFQGMCQMFQNGLIRPSPVKRVPKASPTEHLPMRRATSVSSLPSTKPSASRGKAPKEDKSKVATSNLLKKAPTKKGAAKTPLATIDEAIKNEKIYELIRSELEKVSLRSDERVRYESRILGFLTHQFKLFDRTLALIPFGSTTFGFGGSNSNYNILVDTRKSQQVQALVLESFEKYLTRTDIQLNFEGIAEILASRTLKQQLRMIHKESGIHVLLLADDVAVADTQKVICDFIAFKPICRNLIECILAWRNALNSILAPTGTIAFQFNTYLISVLVIFFMQVNYEVPTTQEMVSIRSNAEAMKKAHSSLDKDLAMFDKILADFFWFYGQRYQIWNHVISLSIGRWQERRIQDQQKHFLPNQKRNHHSNIEKCTSKYWIRDTNAYFSCNFSNRLRDGISESPANWKNCTMYVEDVTRPGINIAAEITTKDAYGFQEMCQVFAKKNICHKICQKDEDEI